RASLEGYAPVERSFEALPGVHQSVAFELDRLPAPRRSGRLTALGWAAGGVGVAAIATGAALLAVDGRPIRRRCNGDNLDADGDCKFIYITRGPGIGVLVGGGVLVAAGVALLITGRKRRQDARVRPTGRGVAMRF
ncbi:MAG: hypothetical protein AAF721_12505, partial [Myxococcota bacterium]